MELGRLTPEEKIRLQTLERNKGRCLMPHEIQGFFKSDALKIVYGIPELEAAQANHIQRVRQQFFSTRLYPPYRDTSCLDVDEVHKFDLAFESAVIDFSYHDGSTRRRRMSDEV